MKQKCPYCLAHLDGSINVPTPDDVVEHIEVTPNPGDFSVCFCVVKLVSMVKIDCYVN